MSTEEEQKKLSDGIDETIDQLQELNYSMEKNIDDAKKLLDNLPDPDTTPDLFNTESEQLEEDILEKLSKVMKT